MKKIFIYGTGSSCETYIKENCNKYKILGFYESSPTKKNFHNLPVKKFTEIENYNFDYLVIASMFYPEILDKILKTNFPISKIKIAISHKDDPRFGILMIDPVEVSENLDKYEIFKTEVEVLKIIYTLDAIKYLIIDFNISNTVLINLQKAVSTWNLVFIKDNHSNICHH